MKKLLPIFILLALVASCGVFKPVYFSRETPVPQTVVDSLVGVYGLQIDDDYSQWPRTTYLSNDSVLVMDYTAVQHDGDTLYIISVTEDRVNETEVLFRKEVKKL